jgi:poly-gamma-glutamate capsule biosynthesis protein CapA/YwtB (metallophosphatase superfamily)
VTLVVTGDLLVHSAVARQARADAGGAGYDFRPMFARVRPYLAAADLAICHQETPFSPDGRIAGYPLFSTPPALATAIRASGWDVCTTASNHSLDRGVAGVRSTLAAFDAAGVGHVGTARTAAEARPLFRSVRGVRVGLLSYTFSTNGLPVPAGRPYLVNLLDPDRILRDAAAARRAGADVVVVALHWGTEYAVTPSAGQRRIAHRLIAARDIDLIVGHHAHVVQPVERVGGKYVVYGLGNFLSNQSSRDSCCPPASQDGVIVAVTFAEGVAGWSVRAVRYLPTWVDIGNGFRVLPVPQALADPATPAGTRRGLLTSWRRTTAAISALGASGVLPATRARAS